MSIHPADLERLEQWLAAGREATLDEALQWVQDELDALRLTPLPQGSLHTLQAALDALRVTVKETRK